MVTKEKYRVLLVSGSAADRRAVRELVGAEYLVTEASTVAKARHALETREQFDLLLTDQQMPDGTGLELLGYTLGYWPRIPVVYLIESVDEMPAVVALKQGAADYVTKEGTGKLRLGRVLENVVARSRAELIAQRRAREMGVLNSILTALNSAVDEQPVLDTIVQEVKALMGTEACSIILIDHEGDQLLVRASTRLPVKDRVLPVPASRSIAGRVVREKQGCITEDVTQDPDWHSLGLEFAVDSMLTVPLVAGEQAIGVLQAINKNVGPFVTQDLELMQSIAAVATAAIMRGQLLTALREQLDAQSQQAAAGR